MPLAGGDTAAQNAECAICFEDLCSEPVAVLLGANRRRACRHYYHLECSKGIVPIVTRGYGAEMEVASAQEARECGREAVCPLCRSPFKSIVQMPDPFTDPKRWFALADLDGTGALKRDEVRDVLRATVACDEDALDKTICRKWSDWDVGSRGAIRFEDLQRLLQFVRENLPGRQQKGEAPFIGSDPLSWFEYWDQDGSGALSKDEVARALIKTFDQADRHVAETQRMLESVWPIFDVTGSNSITKDEFLRRDGLSDTVVASLNRNPRFAEAAARRIADAGSPHGSPTGRPALPPRQPSAPLADGWACRKCTFHNARADTKCSVCDSPADGGAAPGRGGYGAHPAPQAGYLPPQAVGYPAPQALGHAAVVHAQAGHAVSAFPPQAVHQPHLAPSPYGPSTPPQAALSPYGPSTPPQAPIAHGAQTAVTVPVAGPPAQPMPLANHTQNPYAFPPALVPPAAGKRCVVCGNRGTSGQLRRSGWKCAGCVGRPSDPYLRGASD
eukprot:TRINITY_DN1640_c0_g2_i1.p1 TRINITY_DN1640_c0_g2~~TRINITY_DN1640_c0_g2_i1.p1  ORF type:complete len:521 (+),score=110.97 TRINITY_DN1640_c0_g2_i1:64-1563(+)